MLSGQPSPVSPSHNCGSYWDVDKKYRKTVTINSLVWILVVPISHVAWPSHLNAAEARGYFPIPFLSFILNNRISGLQLGKQVPKDYTSWFL